MESAVTDVRLHQPAPASATPRTRPPEADVSSLLYLDSTPARLLVTLFVLSTATFTVLTADVLLRPWQSVIAMVLVCVAGVALLRPHPDPFPLLDTWGVLVVVAASTVLVATNLPEDGALGRATWHLGANTWLLFFLALRRRAWFAWLGMVAMGAITVVWAIESGRGAVAGVMMLNTHMGILLVATLFARLLRQTARRIASLERRALAAAQSQAESGAAASIRAARASELMTDVVPLLQTVADGGPWTSEQRRDFALAEAALRDGVRGRALMLPAVATAVEDARRRGVAVTVLDDRGQLPSDGEVVEAIVTAVVDALQATARGSATIRLVPAGRSTILTIVVTDGDDTTRIALGPDGHRVRTAS